jgi:hypothetical protein
MTRYDEYETELLDTYLNNDQALYNIYRGALVRLDFDAKRVAAWLKQYVRETAYEFYDLKRSKVNYLEVAESLIAFTCEKEEYKDALIQDYKANPRKYSRYTAETYIQEERDQWLNRIASELK